MPAPIKLPQHASLPSAIYGNDEPVLAGVAVRDDADRTRLPRFGDDLWDLGAAIFRVNARYSNYRLNLARIADPLELGLYLPTAFGDEADGDSFLGHGSLFQTVGKTLADWVHCSSPDERICSLSLRTTTASISGRHSAAISGSIPRARARASAAVMSQPMTAPPPIPMAMRNCPVRRCARSQTCQPSSVRGRFSRAGQSGHGPVQASQ